MSDMVLTKTRIRAGVWEGLLTVDSASGKEPNLEVLHLEQPINGVRVQADSEVDGLFLVQVPVPADVLNDGVQTFMIRDADKGEKLSSFTIITGEPMDDDMRAEMDLLRAELDMLKKAFRRHCLETQ